MKTKATRQKLMILTLGLLVVEASAAPRKQAEAQTVANGPYYATPSWDQTLPASTRFIVLSNMKSQAVLDRETGLVWERTPSSSNTFNRGGAVITCLRAVTGGRQGWRLPRVDELLTLADASNFTPGELHLPPGHPFVVSLGQRYWAIDGSPSHPGVGGIFVGFDDSFVETPGALVLNFTVPPFTNFDFPGVGAWCVRGGGGSQMP